MPLEYSSQYLEDLKTLTILKYYLQYSHLACSHYVNQISKTKLLCHTITVAKLPINTRNKVSLLLHCLLHCFEGMDLLTGGSLLSLAPQKWLEHKHRKGKTILFFKHKTTILAQYYLRKYLTKFMKTWCYVCRYSTTFRNIILSLLKSLCHEITNEII